MTKHYRMLINYESDEKRLDIDKLRAKMKKELNNEPRIEQKEPVGKFHSVEIYFDGDIPISKTLMTQMMDGQNLVVMVLQEVFGSDGKWTNVDETLPKICQAENCDNPPKMMANIEENGTRRMYLLCERHADLATQGINFNVWDEK